MRPVTKAQRRVLRFFHFSSSKNWYYFGPWFRHDLEIAAKLQRRGLLCRLHVTWNEHSFSHVTGLTPKGYTVLGITDPWQRGHVQHYPTHTVTEVRLKDIL